MLYSSILDLPSRTSDALFAKHQADLFFSLLLLLEGVTIFIIAPVIKTTSISSKGVRMAFRYVSALCFALFSTAILTWLIKLLSARLR